MMPLAASLSMHETAIMKSFLDCSAFFSEIDFRTFFMLVLNWDFLAAFATLAFDACLTLFLAYAVFANVIISNNG